MTKAGPQGTRLNTRRHKLIKVVRLMAVLLVVKLALTAGLYGVTRIVDIEKHALNPQARDSIRAAGGGHFVRLRDGFTHYQIAGPDSAPLVVLAAGSSVPNYIWAPTFDSLRAAGYRVMRYDYFGRGWSDRPKVPLTQEVYVHQLTELLDSLNMREPITLVGLSYGGTVITSFAMMHPARVGSLVYVAPAIRTPQELPWYLRPPLMGDVVLQWQSRKWAQGQLGDFLYPKKFATWPERYKPQMTYKGFRRARLSDRKANAELDARVHLVEVGKHPRPVLVMWGRQDNAVPFAQSAMVLKALPRAKFVPIDSAGHLPHWEQPAITHAALLGFLRANSAVTLPLRNGLDP